MAKTLLILGAGSDLGQAIGHEFARNGFDVILAARHSQRISAVGSDIEVRHKVKTIVVEFDAADTASHANFFSSLPVLPDVVLYTAGYLGDQTKAQDDWAEAERILVVNYIGAVSILSIAANDLEARREGTLIGISSIAGERGRQSNYIYGSAKSGFSTFLDGLRHRLAKSNVHVITVKPGFVDTKMTAELDLPKLLTAKAPSVAAAVYAAYRSKRGTVYFLPIWRLIMMAIRNIPESVFVKTKL